MQKITVLALAAGFALASCGGGASNPASTSASTPSATTTTAPAAAAPTLTINDADLVDTDLSKVNPAFPITVKLPKDAKLETNPNGGIDVKIGNVYSIVFSNIMDSPAAGVKQSKEFLTSSTSHSAAKFLIEEPAGFVYSHQMNAEANGTTYPVETHFVYYFEKSADGPWFMVEDKIQLDAMLKGNEALFTEALAKQMYGHVAASKMK